MLSLEQLREIDPKFKNVSDAKLTNVRDNLYEIGQLAFECWFEEQQQKKSKLAGK